MLYVDGNYFIFNEVTGESADMLTSDFVLNNCRIECYQDTSILLPVIETTPNMPRVNINKFFQLQLQPHNLSHVSMLKKALPKASNDTITKLIKITQAVRDNTSLNRDITHLAKGNGKVIDLLDQRTKTNTFIPTGANTTIYQQNYDAPIFIHIPSDAQIKNFIDDYTEAPVPDLKNVFKPYPSILYHFVGIEEILKSTPIERPNIITQVVLENKKLFKSLTESTDHYIETFKDIPIEHVIGDSINDRLPIQANETEYYENLRNFLRHHIYIHTKIVYPDYTEEQLQKQTDEDYNKGVMPTGVKLYFNKLLAQILVYQYFHTGRFDESREVFSEDDDGGVETGSDYVSAKHLFFKDQSESPLLQSSADIVLEDYLTSSSSSHGCDVYPEAVIKLMRWGPRKPLTLIVGKDNQNSLDLVRMRTITSTIDFSKLTPIPDDDGCTFQIHGYVTSSIEKDGIIHETVSVLVMNQLYKNPYTEEDHYEFYVISVPDFIEEYKNKKLIIGVKYENDTFIVDQESQQLTQYQLSDVYGHVYYQTDATLDLLVNLGLKNAESQAYALLKPNMLTTYEIDLNQSIIENVLSAPEYLRVHVLCTYWKQYFEANAPIIDSNNLQTILDAYTTAPALQKPTTKEVSDFAYDLVFNDNQKEEVFLDMKDFIYKDDASALTFKPIKTGGRPMVFAYAEPTKGVYVYAALDEVSVNQLVDPSAPTKHTYNILLAFANMMKNKSQNSVFFVSEESFFKILNTVYSG